MNHQPQYFYSSEKRKALDTLYKISANEKYEYIGLLYNWSISFYELHFEVPKDKTLTVVKIIGTL